MYLEKLTAQGFKSFANKNELPFIGMIEGTDRRGITAIVGPNGSGKSNVADAVRWALGEQSMKTLRGKRAEDIIFSGSSTKGKLGMAEVSLYLNNEDGQASVDYSQIVITRRLYRNGDSEYMINNNRVRLSDIQMLLAKANFGQKTYSVIGQGMVEGFLNTTLAERKEFFDEATGVKRFQIKRDEALNKLKSSYENLGQTQMLLVEIEPRLRSLTRQVNKLHKRGGLEEELKILQIEYYSNVWQKNSGKFVKLNNEYLEIEKTKIIKDKKLNDLNNALEKLKVDSENENEFSQWQIKLSKKQGEKDTLGNKLSKIEAQIEVKLEQEGKFDLSFLLNKKEELIKLLREIKEEVANLEVGVRDIEEQGRGSLISRDEVGEKIKTLNTQLEKINKEIQDKIRENAKLSSDEKMNRYLNDVLVSVEEMSSWEDLSKIQGVLKKIESKIRKALSIFNTDSDKKTVDDKLEQKWKEKQDELVKLNIERDKTLHKINENSLKISTQKERIKLLIDKTNEVSAELGGIEGKLNQRSDDFNAGDLEKEQKVLKDELQKIDSEIEKIKIKINKINAEGADKRNKLFSIQKELQNEQNEVNTINNELNDIKVSATRYETKLEDLEIEIRAELGELKEVKSVEINKELNILEAKDKIRNVKKQLEMIGGIDVEIESEYNETKERYDFLSGQEKDFIDTAKDLEKIIKELDVVIRKKFDKEFKVIAKKFEEYFKILFNGGSAKIIKVLEKEEEKTENAEGEIEKKISKEEESVLNIKKIKFLQKHNATGLAGIEIQATPPGKKITSVSMLSGGERALTAIALICAIISANPSPFVVLDEVDAALDEANSERLAKILEDLSHKTQFIIITHNRAPMRRANILYGVTMGDDGVSKLLSVKLDDVATR
jgi:chromosome segregation protein